MEGHVQCGCRCRYEEPVFLWVVQRANSVDLGPAHAVYFATYEAVKHLMGGNQAGVHHPLAAGESTRFIYPNVTLHGIWLTSLVSNERSMRDDCERRAHESI
jgi:hypothetical protein